MRTPPRVSPQKRLGGRVPPNGHVGWVIRDLLGVDVTACCFVLCGVQLLHYDGDDDGGGGDGTTASYKKKYLALQQTVREYEDKLRDAEKRFRQEKR